MMAASSGVLPSGQVISWYGDDLTGSAAVLEVLANAGLPSVLFLEVPSPEELAPYASWPGVGIAGTARHRDPQWMEDHLPQVFEFVAALSAPISHYKVCSTFDSSAEVGSIGKALELAQPVLAGEWTPLVVGAPPIGRYQSFGNLFAEANGVVYRLDRHPTMNRHPVTPMDEADVRVHLAAQTALPIGLVDAASLSNGRASVALQRELDAGARVISLDVIDDAMLIQVGRLIWENRGDRLFAVGSQGVEYALVAYWHHIGMLERATRTVEFGPAERFAAVSGSVSPVTAAQIEWAGDHGFTLVQIDVSAAVDDAEWALEINRAGERALESVGNGGSPIVYTALGPNDPGVSTLSAAIARSGASTPDVRERIGVGLGQVLNRLVLEAGITRCAVVGGDTSGHVIRATGVRSLTFLAPMGHGTSMLAAKAGPRRSSTIEYTLKGGQMGSIDFFDAAKKLHDRSEGSA